MSGLKLMMAREPEFHIVPEIEQVLSPVQRRFRLNKHLLQKRAPNEREAESHCHGGPLSVEFYTERSDINE